MENDTVDCFNRNIERGDIVVIGKGGIQIAFFIKNQRSFQFIPITQWVADFIVKNNRLWQVGYMKYYSHLILRIDRSYFENNLLLSEDKNDYEIIKNYVDGKQL